MEKRYERKRKLYEEKRRIWEGEMAKLKKDLEAKYRKAFPDDYNDRQVIDYEDYSDTQLPSSIGNVVTPPGESFSNKQTVQRKMSGRPADSSLSKSRITSDKIDSRLETINAKS